MRVVLCFLSVYIEIGSEESRISALKEIRVTWPVI